MLENVTHSIIVINILATKLASKLIILVAMMTFGFSKKWMCLISFAHVAPNQYTKKAEENLPVWSISETNLYVKRIIEDYITNEVVRIYSYNLHVFKKL